MRELANEIMQMASASEGDVGDLKDKFDELRNKIHETGADVETWGDKFKKTFAGNVRSALAGAITASFTKYLREIYQNVVKLDSAMTDLQIASGKTREEVKELTKGYADLAKQLGATTAEVAEAADAWLRQGYSIEETNTLIKNSTMLSKLGQIEAAEASTALTSVMKGYKVSVEDSVGIVDKLTAVDMEAAASAGGIATAMAETATSADIAGVSMDKLIGYIATVKEVTQDGDESIGTFYKTLFARMNNVAAGNFVDEETGESLNDVETVLNELGIKLRDVSGEFRNSGEVLDEVAGRWESFDSVSQHAIATAFAGTKQQEKFIALMENYGNAIKYSETAANSAGTALEKYDAYTESIEGKINSLTAAFEEFSMIFLDSSVVTGVVSFLTLLLESVNGVFSVIDALGGLPTVLLAVASALLLANGELLAYNAQMKITAAYQAILMFFSKLKSGLMSVVSAIPKAIAAWKAYAAETVSASTAMQASIPVIGLVLAAVTALVGALSLASGAQDEAKQKAKEAADAAASLSDEITELTYKYLELRDAVELDDAAKESLLQTQDELLIKLKLEKYEVEDLIKKYGSYTEAIKNASIEQLETEERDLRGGLSTSKDDLVKEARNGYFGGGWMEVSGTDHVGLFSNPDKGNYDGYAALKALEDAGFITSGSYSSYTDDDGKKYSQGFALYQRYKYNDLQTPDDILRAYNDLGAMLDIAGDTAGSDNFVYKALYKEYSSMSEYVDAYKTSVDSLNDNLAQQYTISALIGHEIPKTKEKFEAYRQEVINNAINSGEFVGTSEDVANAIDSILSKQSSFTAFYNITETASSGVTVALKSALDVLNEVQDGYDGLTKALTNVTSEGYLTDDALSTLFKLESNNALAGLKLEDILIRDANGYKLAEDSLQKYVQALIAQYTITEAFDTLQDRENAVANLRTLQAVLATLAQTQEDATDADKAYREELEKQQDTYNDQLDKYKELIDLRKNLLDTYAEELEYQKELEKKQRAVSTLQTKLSVARLDSSAAGQARVRELEAELKEAQEDLEDFTLEHAIDVLTDQLDNQYKQHENFIEAKVSEITAAISNVTSAIQDSARSYSVQINELMERYKTEHLEVEDDKPEASVEASVKETTFKAVQDYVTSHGMLEGDKNRWGQDSNFRSLMSAYLDAGGSLDDLKGKTNTVKGEQSSVTNPTKITGTLIGIGVDGGGITLSKSAYNSMIRKDANSNTYINLHDINPNAYPLFNEWAKLNEGYTIKDNGNYYELNIHSLKPIYKFHTGGIVGDVSPLYNTEVFAKLLKGEFVSTPAQMKRFMEETLPQIANYSATGGTNEFNAPLIEITCESVTTEALPELERVVNEAVKEIQKQLDSGMSRTGFKRPQTKRLT